LLALSASSVPHRFARCQRTTLPLMADIKRRPAGIQRLFAQAVHGGIKAVRLRDFSAGRPD
jgi:hypothetical protein